MLGCGSSQRLRLSRLPAGCTVSLTTTLREAALTGEATLLDHKDGERLGQGLSLRYLMLKSMCSPTNATSPNLGRLQQGTETNGCGPMLLVGTTPSVLWGLCRPCTQSPGTSSRVCKVNPEHEVSRKEQQKQQEGEVCDATSEPCGPVG